jgi:hypothetical protein
VKRTVEFTGAKVSGTLDADALQANNLWPWSNSERHPLYQAIPRLIDKPKKWVARGRVMDSPLRYDSRGLPFA